MLRITALSLLFTYLFFFEYLPPFKQVFFPYDIRGFHYPLLNYGFQALSQGRVPEWDPTMYCGLSFVANVQAALFYPPNWLMFAANLGRERLSFKSVEILVVAHFWLAFFLCYIWLRGKRIAPLAGAMAAGVFTFSGYMLSQVQHLGVVAGYAWLPLGFRGIDEAVESRNWRPLWKLIAASAMCFLAGYPPMWFVFCVCAMVYALAGAGRWRAARYTAIALASSLLAVMIQLLPALEATGMKVLEMKYEGGVYGGALYISYVIPNVFDVGRQTIGDADPTRQYFYLGAPAFFGVLCVFRHRGFRRLLPALALAAVSWLMFSNPFGLVGAVVMRSRFLSEICRDWNFLAGLTLAATLLAADSLDIFLKRSGPPTPAWRAVGATCLLAAWSLRQLWIWLPGGPDFVPGWRNLFETVTTLAAFAVGIYFWRGAQGIARACLGIALLATIAVDYKVFGTSKIFNAERGDLDQLYSTPHFPGTDEGVYRQVRSQFAFRMALGVTPLPEELRLFGLTTPQGFDPMLTAQYKEAIEAHTPFRTDRAFDVDPANERLLQLLSVRYFLTNRIDPMYARLLDNPAFRRLEPPGDYYEVFEYARAQPAYRWENGQGSATSTRWTAEHREFVVNSAAGGRLVLIEQFFPGWQATVDGRATQIERWGGAFQAVQIDPGEHRISFRFRSRGLRAGALVSATYVLALCWIACKRPRRTDSSLAARVVSVAGLHH